MEYFKADKLMFDPRPQMGRIFVEGFYQWLKYFSKDKEKLALALEHIFDLSHFYVAAQGDEVIAVTACTNGKSPPISLDRKVLCKVLGLVSGQMAYTMLNRYLVNHPYPFEVEPQTGSIEFVATAPGHRGKGAAFGLIWHVMEATPYDGYVLEVADNNTPAVQLYKKLGFVEFKKVSAPKKGGFDYLLYMRK
jgi:ribosomal protein S18 acetylase RimI-like enzyme